MQSQRLGYCVSDECIRYPQIMAAHIVNVEVKILYIETQLKIFPEDL